MIHYNYDPNPHYNYVYNYEATAANFSTGRYARAPQPASLNSVISTPTTITPLVEQGAASAGSEPPFSEFFNRGTPTEGIGEDVTLWNAQMRDALRIQYPVIADSIVVEDTTTTTVSASISTPVEEVVEEVVEEYIQDVLESTLQDKIVAAHLIHHLATALPRYFPSQRSSYHLSLADYTRLLNSKYRTLRERIQQSELTEVSNCSIVMLRDSESGILRSLRSAGGISYITSGHISIQYTRINTGAYTAKLTLDSRSISGLMYINQTLAKLLEVTDPSDSISIYNTLAEFNANALVQEVLNLNVPENETNYRTCNCSSRNKSDLVSYLRNLISGREVRNNLSKADLVAALPTRFNLYPIYHVYTFRIDTNFDELDAVFQSVAELFDLINRLQQHVYYVFKDTISDNVRAVGSYLPGTSTVSTVEERVAFLKVSAKTPSVEETTPLVAAPNNVVPPGVAISFTLQAGDGTYREVPIQDLREEDLTSIL